MSSDASTDELMQRITAEFDDLPHQLQNIARYIEQNRNSIVVQRISEIAKGAGVHPSAVVRFAQRFGFTGFSELQGVFRDAYTEKVAPTRSYQGRIRRVIKGGQKPLSSADMAVHFINASRAGLDELIDGMDPARFQAAIDLLATAENVYVVGVRRSFPIAAYIVYALQHTHKRVHLVSGLGSMYREQINSIGKGDALIAISFLPYGKETLFCMRAARAQKAKILAITDSEMGPVADLSHIKLIVHESKAFAFRSLTSAICLCQALFVALAYRLELEVDEIAHRGGFDD